MNSFVKGFSTLCGSEPIGDRVVCLRAADYLLTERKGWKAVAKAIWWAAVTPIFKEQEVPRCPRPSRHIRRVRKVAQQMFARLLTAIVGERRFGAVNDLVAAQRVLQGRVNDPAAAMNVVAIDDAIAALERSRPKLLGLPVRTATAAVLAALAAGSLAVAAVLRRRQRAAAGGAAPCVLLSYRRTDSAALCGRVYDRLVTNLGRRPRIPRHRLIDTRRSVRGPQRRIHRQLRRGAGVDRPPLERCRSRNQPARRHAIELSDGHFTSDVARLVRALVSTAGERPHRGHRRGPATAQWLLAALAGVLAASALWIGWLAPV